MAFTTIDSAGSLFEAGNSGDKVEVQSGASTRTTIDGGTGADTLVFLSGTNAAGQTAIDVNLAGGADGSFSRDQRLLLNNSCWSWWRHHLHVRTSLLSTTLN